MISSSKLPKPAAQRRRPNISAEVADTVRRMIADGTLAAGTRINEVHLALALDVSRTPLREALSALVAEGALEAVPRRGVFVRDLTADELRALYPIRALLDPEALRLAGIPSERAIQSLTHLNQKLRQAKSAEARINLDDRWHLELIAQCPNPVLIDLIRQFMRRTRRYELAYLKEVRHTQAAHDQHRKIIAALRDRKLDLACNELRRNLTGGEQPILEWLEQRSR